MPINVTWDSDDQKIVRFFYDEAWTWEEFFEAVHQTKRMAEIAPSPIGIIMEADTSHLRFPPNMVTHLKNALRHRHPKTKIIVVTIRSTFLRTLITTIAKVSGKDDSRALKIADSLDEARKMIYAHLDQGAATTR